MSDAEMQTVDASSVGIVKSLTARRIGVAELALVCTTT
jgi:hypothetical protein